MEIAKRYLKEKSPELLINTLIIIGVVLIINFLFADIQTILFNFSENTLNLRQIIVSFNVVILLPFFLLAYYFPQLLRFIAVFLDILKYEEKTIVVQGLSKPHDSFNLLNFLAEENHISYLFWKTKTKEKQKLKFLVPNYIKREKLKGKTTKDWYTVTYLKHSKIIIGIEKFKNNTGDGPND